MILLTALIGMLATTSSASAKINVDVSQLTERHNNDRMYGENFFAPPRKTCKKLEKLTQELEGTEVVLLWKTCIKGSQTGAVMGREDVLENNPTYDPRIIADYKIIEEVKTVNKRTLVGTKHVQQGHYILLKKNSSNDFVEQKRSLLLGSVKTGSVRPGVYNTNNSIYRPKHFNRIKKLLELLEFATQDSTASIE